MAQASSLYTIGAIVMACPAGLNPQDAIEEFGGDFAVKAIVGAQQPREFVGPSDTRLVLSGAIYPYRFASIGLSSGQAEIATLKSYAAAGQPVPVLRGGVTMGFYLVEKVQLKHSFLSIQGIGRRQEFVIQLVQSPTGPTPQSLISIFTGLVSALGGAS